MTDKKFTKKLQKLAKDHNKYLETLAECENEYERRYGLHPSDVEDDYWIDSFHIGTSGENETAESIDKAAKLAFKLSS